ncbi:hypothetical protein SDC9_166487 [bioreactor metagenome]|uniref:Uncharacterized protein n=1 Tax=bioreactor metagenome TaxID=1076179 RepID=A0A645FX22_9ZZZZ
MQRVKRRTFSGVVCEQEVFTVSDRVNIKKAEPRERFKTAEEREQHRIGISRRKHTRLFNENFSPRSLYSTLTLDDENEVHEFRDMRRLRDNYVRNLKRAYPDAVIFAYIGRGKNTSRMHLHMVSNDVPEEVIKEKWKYGRIVRIENLREHNYYDGIDHGQDYTGLANYLFDHWTPEQGGHRWKQTKNAKKPERETPKIAIRAYSENKPPIAPKGYILVESRSNKFGYLYYKYVLQPPKRSRRRKC